MTAEVVVMNKLAVALAADSAVTISYVQEGRQKIYNSANKLFMISKFHPVGIMIYNNADFMGVPWETIIKTYRNQLGSKSFPTLEEYVEDLIRFLENIDNFLFPNDIRKQYFEVIGLSISNSIFEMIDEEVNTFINKRGKIDDDEIKKLAEQVIRQELDEWEQTQSPFSFDTNIIDNLIIEYRGLLDSFIKLFDKYKLANEIQDSLRRLIVIIICKANFPTLMSGIVIAGFGDRDMFPKLDAIVVEVLLNDKLKYRKDERTPNSFSISPLEDKVIIIPFAQQEMVETFLKGIDPRYRQKIIEYLHNFVEEYPNVILNEIVNLNQNNIIEKQQQKDLTKLLREKGTELLEELFVKMQTFEDNNYTQPILDNVENLPKDELAALAEALVNITSLKRRVSTEPETVGGPVDVAIISKGDGFVWIKRKHYFDANLNSHFFSKYLYDQSNIGGTNGKGEKENL